MQNLKDVIVIGLGATGSAALYQLAKKGADVLGIDQFEPPHVFGSSHGDTRITRQAIGEGDQYVPLVLRSYEIWKELEKNSGTNLLTITGGLVVEPEESKISHGAYHFLQNTIDVAKRFNIAHEILDAQQLQERFPQFVFRGDEKGYYEGSAGFLHPEKCIEVQLELARKNGAETRYNEKALSFKTLTDGSVVVLTDKGEYAAKKLVVSVGPWIAAMLPEFAHLFKVYRQVLFWFDIKGAAEAYAVGNLPVFMFQLQDGNEIYGFPAVDGPRGGIKVAYEELLDETTPEKVERAVSEGEIEKMYEKCIRPLMPGISRSCIRTATCMYTITPDSGFVIDTLPDNHRIIIASPCSGHGFKHSAAIGEALSELVMESKSHFDLSAFSLNRFKKS